MTMTTAALLVVYSDHLERCREFYTGLGLEFVPEKHGTGPEHYAATLPEGLVIELYPATPRRPVSSNRLGFGVSRDIVDLEPGRHVLTDPDGRAVEVYVEGELQVTRADQARDAIQAEFGAAVTTEITEHPTGAVSLTLRVAGRVAVIDGDTTGEWGLSVDPDEGFTGHDITADSAAEIVAQARRALLG